MATLLGTVLDDILIGGELGGSDLVIDGLEGDDYVELANFQIFRSGPGNDTVVFTGEWGGWANWSALAPVTVNLAEGWAIDSYGDQDTLVDVSVVHISQKGGQVIGSARDETIFCFGGNTELRMDEGYDVVNIWDLSATDFKIRQFGNEVELTSTDYVVTLTDVEEVNFTDLSVNLSLGMVDGYAFIATDQLMSIEETEMSPGWWYAGVYNEPQLVGNFPQAPIVIDVGNDGDLDVVVPLNRGYRTGVDTRTHFQVFENRDGTLTFSEELTAQTPFITGSRRSAEIFIERYQSNAIVTVAHDTAIETETRTDIPWRFGDISFMRLDTFEQVTAELVPEDGLLRSSLVDRFSAVQAHSMAVGDLNCDGKEDVLVGDHGEAFALLQTTEGTFEYLTDPLWTEVLSRWKEPTLEDATTAYPLDLDIDDFNGDGFDDILFGRGHGTTLSRIFFNDGTGVFGFDSSVALPASIYGPSNTLHMKTLSDDFDKDGDVDLIILQSRNDPYYGGNYLQYLENDGQGNFTDLTETRLISPNSYPDTYSDRLRWTDFWQVIDFDGDGDFDIAGHTVSSYNSRAPLIFVNDGNGYFDLEYFAKGSNTPIAWADFDDDGKIEVIRSNGYSELTFDHAEAEYYSSSVARAYDLHGNAGKVAKILGAVFGAEQVSNKEYAGIGLDYLDNKGYSYEGLMDLALKASGCVSNEDVVNKLYENVVGVAPLPEQAQPFVAMLEGDNPVHTWGSIGVMAADLELLTTKIDLTGLAETGLEYTLFS